MTEKPCKTCKGTGVVEGRNRSQVGKMSRQKGSRGELKVAKMISEAIGVPPKEVCRTPGSGAIIERGDLRFSNRAAKLFPFFVEVKHREGWDFWRVWEDEDVEVWPPHLWFKDAVEKQEEQLKTGFTIEVLDVLLVLMQNRRPPLVMLLAPQGEAPQVGPYCIRRLDSFLEDHAKSG